MPKIWFRVGMEANVTEEEMKELLIYSGQLEGERDCRKAHEIMNSIIKKSRIVWRDVYRRKRLWWS